MSSQGILGAGTSHGSVDIFVIVCLGHVESLASVVKLIAHIEPGSCEVKV